MIVIKPFHQWKADQVAKEGFLREDRYWYYRAYGEYVLKERKKHENK